MQNFSPVLLEITVYNRLSNFFFLINIKCVATHFSVYRHPCTLYTRFSSKQACVSHFVSVFQNLKIIFKNYKNIQHMHAYILSVFGRRTQNRHYHPQFINHLCCDRISKRNIANLVFYKSSSFLCHVCRSESSRCFTPKSSARSLTSGRPRSPR